MNRFYGAENYIQNIIKDYSDMIFRISYSYMKNISDAEDITQEVLIKLLEKEPNFEDNNHEKAWLIRIAINLCKDKLKSSWFKKRTILEEECFYDATEEDNEIISFVLNLPIKYRSVVLLFYYEDYSIAEIANILQIDQFFHKVNKATPILAENLEAELGDYRNEESYKEVVLTLKDGSKLSFSIIKDGYVHYGVSNVSFKVDNKILKEIWDLLNANVS